MPRSGRAGAPPLTPTLGRRAPGQIKYKSYGFRKPFKNLGKSNDFLQAPLLWGARLAEEQQRGTVVAGSEPMKNI